jgi:hypothetical protein
VAIVLRELNQRVLFGWNWLLSLVSPLWHLKARYTSRENYEIFESA